MLCKSLGLKVPDWDGKQLNHLKFRILKNDFIKEIIQTTRIGAGNFFKGENEKREYRFIDAEYVTKCTKNPLTIRRNPPTVTKLLADSSL